MIGKGRDLLRRTRRRNHPVRLLASDQNLGKATTMPMNSHNEPMSIDRMVLRRTRKGYNREESAKLMQILLRDHAGDFLVYALVYNEYATEAQAQKFVNNRP